jgi:hypothetical protein
MKKDFYLNEDILVLMKKLNLLVNVWQFHQVKYLIFQLNILLEFSNFHIPDWFDIVEDTKFIITKLATKLKELEVLYKKLGTRPDFFDQKNDDEARTSILVDEIKKLINTAFKNINGLRSYASTSHSILEKKLVGNIVQGLIVSLNDITRNFREEQSNYFKQINSIQETANDFFEWDLDGNTKDKTSVESFDNFLKPSTTATTYNASQMDDLVSDINLDEHFQHRRPNRSGNDQLMILKNDEKMMELREREVNGIVQSIVELNQIYKDLSHLVHEQGKKFLIITFQCSNFFIFFL